MNRLLLRSAIGVGIVILLVMSDRSSADMVSVASSPLSEFVIFSGGATPNIQSNFETEIGGHTLINGDIGSNQDLFLQGNPLPGYPAQLNGSAYVGGYLKMGQDLTVGSLSGPLREIVVNGDDDGDAPVNAVEADFLGNLYGNMYVTGQATGVTVDLGSVGNIRSLADLSGGNLEFGGGPLIMLLVTSTETYPVLPRIRSHLSVCRRRRSLRLAVRTSRSILSWTN